MRPSRVMKMFSGFRSRWMIPFSCAAAETVGDLHSVLDGLALRHGAGIEHVAQALAFEEFGDEKRRAIVLADIEDGKNVGMVERGHRARLLLEPAQAVGILRENFRKNFQRDVAAKARIASAVHLAHAAGADRGLDFVGA